MFRGGRFPGGCQLTRNREWCRISQEKTFFLTVSDSVWLVKEGRKEGRGGECTPRYVFLY